ncbi:MAG: thiamine phosphate synthase [Nitrospirae bacterium]|nr:thiamine phosphate synthase [Nitrospirota bacterium]
MSPAHARSQSVIDFALYLITDRRLTGGVPLPDAVADAARAGACAVQLREKDLSTRELLDLARQVRERTAAAGATLFINDRVDLCWAAGADGVHLREDSLPTDVVRRLVGVERFIGVSAHSMEAAVRAEAQGADFVLFGPVYDTPSKRAYGPPQGVDRLAEVAARVRVPVFAVGGVTAARVPELLGAGAHGVGVISAVFGAGDVFRAAEAMQRALRAGKS